MMYAAALLALAPVVLASPLAVRDTNVQLHPNGDQSLCLQFVAGPNGAKTPSQVTNDSPLTVGPCNTPNSFNQFDISFGDQLGIKLSGSNMCIDAGINPHNNGPAKLYTCYPGVVQQHWYYTSDLHIAITGGNQCLDRQNGGSTMQTYQCFYGNVNQIWTIGSAPPPPSSTSAPPPPPSSSSTSPASTPTPPSNNGVRLHLNGDQTKCLTIQPDQGTKAGAAITVATCGDPSSVPGTYQVFDLVRGPTTVKPHNYDTSFCVDFGTDTDGSLVTLQKCNGGASQKLYWTGVGDDHIAWEGGRTCLDAQAGSANPSGPFPYLARAQAWACIGYNTNQRWS